MVAPFKYHRNYREYIMKFGLKLCSTILLLSLFSTAQAQSYIGGQLTLLNYDQPNTNKAFIALNDDTAVSALTLQVGKQLNNWVSLEARVSLGILDGSLSIPGGGDVEMELSKMYGVYSLFHIRDQIELLTPYLLLGYSKADMKASNNGISIEESQSSLSYALGLAIEVDDTFSINFELGQYVKDDAYELDGFAAGFQRSF